MRDIYPYGSGLKFYCLIWHMSQPKDMAMQTTALIKEYLQSPQGKNSLFLAVVKATSAPNSSVAMQILHEANLYTKTFGVFTFCDEIGPKHARRLKQWVCEPSKG